MTTSTSVPDRRRWWALFLLCTAQFVLAACGKAGTHDSHNSDRAKTDNAHVHQPVAAEAQPALDAGIEVAAPSEATAAAPNPTPASTKSSPAKRTKKKPTATPQPAEVTQAQKSETEHPASHHEAAGSAHHGHHAH